MNELLDKHVLVVSRDPREDAGVVAVAGSGGSGGVAAARMMAARMGMAAMGMGGGSGNWKSSPMRRGGGGSG